MRNAGSTHPQDRLVYHNPPVLCCYRARCETRSLDLLVRRPREPWCSYEKPTWNRLPNRTSGHLPTRRAVLGESLITSPDRLRPSVSDREGIAWSISTLPCALAPVLPYCRRACYLRTVVSERCLCAFCQPLFKFPRRSWDSPRATPQFVIKIGSAARQWLAHRCCLFRLT